MISLTATLILSVLLNLIYGASTGETLTVYTYLASAATAIMLRFLSSTCSKNVHMASFKSTFLSKYGRWAMVVSTHARVATFCEELVRVGVDGIVVVMPVPEAQGALDRLQAHMQELKPELGFRGFTRDLALPGAVEELLQETDDLQLGLLVCDAMLCPEGHFLMLETEQLDDVVNRNVGALTRLVSGFAKRLVAHKRRGGIILMSALAGLLGTPRVACFSASQAYIATLGEALFSELYNFGIDVLTVRVNEVSSSWGRKSSLYVVRSALVELGHTSQIIPGLLNSLRSFVLTRLCPRSIALAHTYKTMTVEKPKTT